MTFRKRPRLFVTALFNPRRAVADGLYDGSVVKSQWILAYRLVSMLLSSVVYEPIAVLMKGGLLIPILFVVMVVTAAVSDYWLMPRLLLFSLTPRPAKQLTKREKREQRSNPGISFGTCRQLVLFSQLVTSIAFMPLTIISIIYTLKLYLGYAGIFAALIWLYTVIYPAFAIPRKRAVFKILTCYTLNFLISGLAFVVVVFICAYIASAIFD